MNNNKKIILDLCGGTGAWSKPYKDAGYDVRVITLPLFDVVDPYIIEQCVNLKPYAILAAPPCTEFSLAKTTAPRDFKAGFLTVKACLEIIYRCQINGKLAWWALENPLGLLRRFLGNPPYTFQQWWYGADRVKRTDLWGRFEIPKRTVLIRGENVAKATHNRNSGWYSNATAKKRAITPAGFAEAFFKANQ